MSIKRPVCDLSVYHPVRGLLINVLAADVSTLGGIARLGFEFAMLLGLV